MILSDEEVNFYNLFFAYLSLIFAQSFCLSQWFGKPRKFFEKRNIHKSVIINDQKNLNIYFFSWFTRLTTIYALGMMMSISGFYVFSFYPEYNYISVLIIIVLFLQTWVSIRRIYKRKSFKWMLFSAAIISVLSFGLSRINLIDYQKINQIYLEHNVPLKYNLELVEIEKNERVYSSLLYLYEIYIAKQQSDTVEDNNPLFIFEGEELSMDDLKQNLLLSMEFAFFNQNTTFLPLYIDKSIKTEHVNRIKEMIIDVGFLNVAYGVIPKNREFDKRFYSNYFSLWRLIDKKEYKNLNLEEFELITVCYVNDVLKINDTICSTKDFYFKIKHQIEISENYLLRFKVDDETIFEHYMFVLNEFKRAVESIRNEYALKNYSDEFDNLDIETNNFIRNKILLRMIEE
ncbi:MAG: hypothetical protein FWH18_04075 [Marinilabiliaceae bacterium]|nr:hypothetical protein [Marinilabiliaceae bacterium]